MMASIFVKCEYLHEDREFLLECFDHLCDPAKQVDGVPPFMTGEELELWVSVLNHGQKPTIEELADVVATLDQYKLAYGADSTDGCFEEEDFMLVTFDYYLAFGHERMRALFTDLLLT